MNQVKTLGMAVALVISLGAGCKKGGGGAGGGASGKAAEGGANEAQILDLYVECFNEVDHRVHDSWQSYAEWVDPDKGPTGKEKTVDGIDQIDDYHAGKCTENLNQAIANGATGPLADATKSVITALGTLLPLVAETKTYYDQKNYKDDAFAKGKELHGKLVAAFQAFDKAEDTLRGVWDERHRISRDAELARLEKEHGRKSEQFVTSQIMNTGEALIEAVTVAKLDEPALRAAITKYQAAYDEMNAFFGPALTASTDTDRYVFKQAAETLLIQTKEAVRSLDKDKTLPKDGDGSETALLDKYNGLVEESNSITWD
jgi:hypothetical protein